MELLGPVGDRADLVAQPRLRQIAKQRDRADDAAELPQRPVQPIATRVVAQASQQRHRGQPAFPDGDPGPQQVRPVLLDQRPVDHVVAEQRVDVPVLRRGVRPVEVQVVPVPYPRQQLEPEQRREPEDRQALALGIAMDLVGLDVGLVGQQRVQDVHRLPDPAGDEVGEQGDVGVGY